MENTERDGSLEEGTRMPANDRPLILINVFTVAPDQQERLIELLTKVTGEHVRNAPGFMSSTLHRGLDGTKVTMYAVWESEEAYAAMRNDPGPAAYLQEALSIATFDPGMYEIVETFTSSR
jgi:heme-degrading monooxygenase HmoA